MAAGLGFKTFTTGEVLTAADTNGYLMQGVLVFASSAARAAAITSPQEGQYSYLKDTNSTEYYDGAAWIAAPIGDITGVTAGVGITGGGTSGTVTVTNDMATTITAAGDIVVGTGSGTYDNLPIGTTAQVLTADTTVSPYKVKWATPASTTPSFVGVRCTVSGSQTIANATSAYIAWTTEVIDTNGFHDNATNNTRLTVPSGKTGYYQVYSTICFVDSSAGRQIWLEINRAGTQFGKIIYAQLSGYPTGFHTTTTTYLNVGDYMECGVYQTSGGNLGTEGFASITGCMQFGMNYLGA